MGTRTTAAGVFPFDERPRSLHFVALALILAAAIFLRLIHLDKHAMSADELGSMETAAARGQAHLYLPRGAIIDAPPALTHLDGARSVWAIPGSIGDDVHPPLYYIILRLWQDVFGGSDAASRALSVAAGVLGVLLLFDVGRMIGGPGVGLWASLLMATAVPQIVYSRDARMYALLTLFGLTAMSALVRIEKGGPSFARCAALALSVAAMGLTHYFSVGAGAAIGLYAFLGLRGSAKRKVILALAAGGVLVLGLWGRGLWTQRASFSSDWAFWFDDKGPGHVVRALGRAAEMPMRYLAEPRAGTNGFAMFSAVLFALPLLARRRPELLLPGLWLIAPVGLVAGLDLARQTQQLHWPKYTILAAPAVYLAMPLLLRSRSFPKWMAHLAPATAAAACVIGLPLAYEKIDDDYLTDNWKQLAADLDRRVQPGDTLVLAGLGWAKGYTGTLYMGLERYSRRMHHPVVLLEKEAPENVLKAMAGRPAWLVTSFEIIDTPAKYLPTYRAQRLTIYPTDAILYQVTPADEAVQAR